MLTIKNIQKIEGWVFRNGDYEIKRAFEYQDDYIFYIETIHQTPVRYIVALSRKTNNDSEQLYCLRKADGKVQSLNYSNINSMDRFTLYIEKMIE
jgi:hypothetical protein